MMRKSFCNKLIAAYCICGYLISNYPIKATAQAAQRLAQMGMQGSNTVHGMIVDSVLPGATFPATPIRKGDILQSVNSIAIADMETYQKTVSRIRAGEDITIKYKRNDVVKIFTVKAVARPFETSAVADVIYDWVAFRGGSLRTITWKPKNKNNVPCILLIPGYNCGSIDNFSKSYNGKLIDEWVKSGFAVVTIEKSGVGDSYNCVPCTEVDLATDIASFDAGYTYMEQLSFVDKARLFIWGHSMGGTIAPEIAKNHQPKGVMVFGCVFRPWSEFLLEMHRVQKPLIEKLTYTETEAFVRQIHKVYDAFFIGKKSPEELHKNPEYQKLVETDLEYKPGSNNMWGRHWRFWMQLDSVNMAQSWGQLQCPVLVLHGGADHIQCSELEARLIAETVNEHKNGNAEMITIPDLDHLMMKSANWQEANKNLEEAQYTKGNFNDKIAETTIDWLKKHL